MGSIVDLATYCNLYPDTDILNVIPNIVTQNVTATRDETGTPKDLVLGASSNVEIQFMNQLQLTQVYDQNSFDKFASIYLDTSNVTHIKPAIRELQINDLFLQTEDDKIYISSYGQKSQGVFFKDASTFEQNALFMQNITALGHVTGQTMNVWYSSNGTNGFSNPEVQDIGFGFQISDNHQLELMRVVKFNDSTKATHRVAVFGSTKAIKGTGDGSSYLVFDELNGISQSGLCNAQGYPTFSVCNVSLTGNTTTHGDILPNDPIAVSLGTSGKEWQTVYTGAITGAPDVSITGSLLPTTDIQYDLGSATNRFRDLYLSGNTIYIGDGGVISFSNAKMVLNDAPIITNVDLAGNDLKFNEFAASNILCIGLGASNAGFKQMGASNADIKQLTLDGAAVAVVNGELTVNSVPVNPMNPNSDVTVRSVTMCNLTVASNITFRNMSLASYIASQQPDLSAVPAITGSNATFSNLTVASNITFRNMPLSEYITSQQPDLSAVSAINGSWATFSNISATHTLISQANLSASNATMCNLTVASNITYRGLPLSEYIATQQPDLSAVPAITGSNATFSNLTASNVTVSNLSVQGVLTSVNVREVNVVASNLTASNISACNFTTMNNLTASNLSCSNLVVEGIQFSFSYLDSNVTASNFYARSNDTVSAPGYSWTNDVTTGMYHPNINQIGLSTNGINRVLISASNVLIGTQSANTGINPRFQVESSHTNYVGAFINTAATNTSNQGLIVSGGSSGTGLSTTKLLTVDRYTVANVFNVYADGAVKAAGAYATQAGADYAERFEWEDGNINNEDRVGKSVVFVQGTDKIRLATVEDSESDILGVVSANPSIIGNDAWSYWPSAWLLDDFGRKIVQSQEVVSWTDVQGTQYRYDNDKVPEGVVVPEDAVRTVEERHVPNPNYDALQPYVPRSERKEWAVIGLLGKLRLHASTPKRSCWRKIRDVSSSVEEWLISF